MQLGGEHIGSLGAPGSAIPIEFAPAEVGNTIEGFYEARNMYFPDWYDLQQDYYSLAAGKARRDYKNTHPQLEEYFAWRRKFLQNNPATVPYLDDDFEPNYRSQEEMEAAFANEPSLGAYEISARLINAGGYSLVRAVEGYLATGSISSVARAKIEEIASGMGITFSRLVNMYAQSKMEAALP